MENKEEKKSLLLCSKIKITDKISIKIPTVGEVLEDEQAYYGMVNSLTAVPMQYMVQLDNMKIDFTTISDYQLFLMLFPVYAKGDMSLVFEDMFTNDYIVGLDKTNNTDVLYIPTNGLDYVINEHLYYKIVDAIRKINGLKRLNGKPGNEHARQYLIEKERNNQNRHLNKKYEPYLEKLVIALVNRSDFKYNYKEVLDLSIFQFNQSFEQIKRNVDFDKTMIGVYTGNVDTSKLHDKSCLSWLKI